MKVYISCELVRVLQRNNKYTYNHDNKYIHTYTYIYTERHIYSCIHTDTNTERQTEKQRQTQIERPTKKEVEYYLMGRLVQTWGLAKLKSIRQPGQQAKNPSGFDVGLKENSFFSRRPQSVLKMLNWVSEAHPCFGELSAILQIY
jgi:hypothetical protein